jgi:hypothetical protein
MNHDKPKQRVFNGDKLKELYPIGTLVFFQPKEQIKMISPLYAFVKGYIYKECLILDYWGEEWIISERRIVKKILQPKITNEKA